MAAGTTHGRDVKALVAQDDPRHPGTRTGPRRSSVPPLLPKTKSGIFAVGTRRPVPVRVPPNPVPNLEDLPTLDGDPEDELDTVRIRRIERVDIDSVLRRVSSVPPPPFELRLVDVPKAPPARPSLEPPDPMAVDGDGSFWLRTLGTAATIVVLAGAITLLGRAAVLVVDIARHVRADDATARLTSVHRESRAMRTSAMPTQLFAVPFESSPTESAATVELPRASARAASVEVPFVGPPMPAPEVAREPEAPASLASQPTSLAPASPVAPAQVASIHSTSAVGTPRPARLETEPEPSEEASSPLEEEAAPLEEVALEPAPAPADPAALALAARLDPPAVEAPPPSIPSREDVGRALRAATPQVNSCSSQPVVLTVRVSFASDGSVTAARLATTPPSTTDAGCVWAALRSAHVPPFARPTFTTSYVYTRP